MVFFLGSDRPEAHRVVSDRPFRTLRALGRGSKPLFRSVGIEYIGHWWWSDIALVLVIATNVFVGQSYNRIVKPNRRRDTAHVWWLWGTKALDGAHPSRPFISMVYIWPWMVGARLSAVNGLCELALRPRVSCVRVIPERAFLKVVLSS